MRGICRSCDMDMRIYADNCYIVVEEIDYGVPTETNSFCSFGCLKRWYEL